MRNLRWTASLLLLLGAPRALQAQTGPNLSFYQFPGWSRPLVARPSADATPTSVPDPTFLQGDACGTFWNIGGANFGNVSTGGGFYAYLYVDGNWQWWALWSAIPASYGFYGLNLGAFCLTGGRHTYQVVLDPTGAIAETNESDNQWGHQWVSTSVVMSPGQTSMRSAPPNPYAGIGSIVDGSPIYANCDGLRVNPQLWWTAVTLHAVSNTDDDDLYLHPPSSGASNGFGPWSAASGYWAGDLDFVVINSNVVGTSPWDVGVQNYSGGTSDYRASQITNGYLSFGSAVAASFATNDVLKLWEVYVAPGQVGPVTVTVTRQGGATSPLVAAWLDQTFSVGGRFDAAATQTTGPNGQAKINLNVSTSGYYAVVVYRDPINGLNAENFTVRVQTTPIVYRAWSLQRILGIDFLAQMDIDRGFVQATSFNLGTQPNPFLASDPLHDRLYVLSTAAGGSPPLTLYTVKPSTGQILYQQPTGALGAIAFNGLAWDPLKKRLLTLALISFGEFNFTYLMELDPATGAASPVGQLTEFYSAAMDISPTGVPYTLFPNISLGSLQLRQLDLNTLTGSVVQNWYLGAGDNWQEMAFLGDELWGLNTGGSGAIAVRLDPVSGATSQVNFGSGTIMHGLAMRSCVDASPELTASDVPNDSGGAIRLNWTPYVQPSGVASYQIIRATEPCALLDPDLPPVGSVTAPTRLFTDATAANYTGYYYGVRVVHTSGSILQTLYAGPVFAFPNLLINEFTTNTSFKQSSPRGGWQAQPTIGEQVEIRNQSSTPLDLTGFRLSNGPGDPLPDEEPLSGVIPAGGLLVHTLTTISLPHTGGTLALLPPTGTAFVIDKVAYGTAGGAPAAPFGFTVSRVEGTSSTDPVTSSFETAPATFGQTNSVPTPDLGSSIILNEVLHTTAGGGDYVEVYNPLGASVVLSQFAISDGVNFMATLPSGLQLSPGQLKLFQEGSAGSFTQELSTGLLYLYKVTTSGQFQRVDQLGWLDGPAPGTAPMDALVRVPDGLAVYLGSQGANWYECGGDVTLKYGLRTPGQPNQDPSVTQVVVDRSGAGNYLTITAALAARGPGTRILVNPGTYSENFNLEDGIEIRGAGVDPAAVVITGGRTGAIVSASGVGATAVLAGVTLRGGVATDGAALLVNNASPVLRNVRFENGHASQRGGAVLVQSGNPDFEGCLFYQNSAGLDGGAIAVLAGNPIVSSSLFVLNESMGRGGALFSSGGTTRLEHCVLDLNAAHAAGAGVVHASLGTLDLSFSVVSRDMDGSPLIAEHVATQSLVKFHCGDLFGHPEWFSMSSGGIDTQTITLTDPQFCQPLELNYAFKDSSPLVAASARCGAIIGLAGPPCAVVATFTPPSDARLVTRLHPPAPNPFNPATVLRFDLAGAGKVSLSLYDLRGRRVVDLMRDAPMEAGAHDVDWHGRDGSGHRVASGVYLARLTVDGQAIGDPQRLVLLK